MELPRRGGRQHRQAEPARLRVERAWGGEEGGSDRVLGDGGGAPPIPASPCAGGAALAPQRLVRAPGTVRGVAARVAPQPGQGRINGETRSSDRDLRASQDLRRWRSTKAASPVQNTRRRVGWWGTSFIPTQRQTLSRHLRGAWEAR